MDLLEKIALEYRFVKVGYKRIKGMKGDRLMTKKLTRSYSDRKIAGVCGGIAEYFNMDSTIVRILFILLSLTPVNGILLYLIAWLLIPEA